MIHQELDQYAEFRESIEGPERPDDTESPQHRKAAALDSRDEVDHARHDDDEVKTIPRVCHVGALATDSHRDHLDDHLGEEEEAEALIANLEKLALLRLALWIERIVRRQGDAIKADYEE